MRAISPAGGDRADGHLHPPLLPKLAKRDKICVIVRQIWLHVDGRGRLQCCQGLIDAIFMFWTDELLVVYYNIDGVAEVGSRGFSALSNRASPVRAHRGAAGSQIRSASLPP